MCFVRQAKTIKKTKEKKSELSVKVKSFIIINSYWFHRPDSLTYALEDSKENILEVLISSLISFDFEFIHDYSSK